MVWDRMDDQFNQELLAEVEDEVLRLEAECRRRSLFPLPVPGDVIAPEIQHRRQEMELVARRDALRAALAAAARDPYANRSPYGEIERLRQEIATLERRCAERGIAPPPFTVDPRWYEHTRRMAYRRRRDALQALLE